MGDDIDWEHFYTLSKMDEGRKEVLNAIEGIMTETMMGTLIFSRQYKNLRLAILTLRNCSIEYRAEALLLKSNIAQYLLNLCQHCAVANTSRELDTNDHIYFDNDLDDTQRKTLVLILCQFFANFSAASMVAADLLIGHSSLNSSSGNHGKTCGMQHLFAAAVVVQHRVALSVCWHTLYNIIRKDRSCCDDRLQALLRQRSLLCQALLSLCDISSGAPEEQGLQEWLLFTSLRLIESQSLVIVWDTLGSADNIRQGTQEQVVFLQLLCMALEDPGALRHLRLGSEEQDSRDCSRHSWHLEVESGVLDLPQHLEAFCLHFTPLLCAFSRHTIANTGDGREHRLREDLHQALACTGLQLLSAVLSACPTISSSLQHRLALETKLASYCLDNIDGRDVGTVRRAGTIVSECERELVRNSLQLLSNLLYRCPIAQDLAFSHRVDAVSSSRPGLNSVLCHCVTDFANPLAREWALLCVRNACEGNERIQEYIAGLKAQDAVVVDEALAAAGMQVRFDAGTGRFSVQQQPRPS
jgi:hypothetical protein